MQPAGSARTHHVRRSREILQAMAITVPGLGSVTEDDDWLVTEPRHIRVLGKPGRFMIDGYEPDASAGLVACIEAFCSLEASHLTAVSDHVFAHYRDVAADVTEEPGFPQIPEPADVWDFVTLTDEPLVRQHEGHWFVLDNECAWEPEHGLMIVLKEGREVVKVSEYDDHLTNRHAFADDTIPEDAVYWSP